MCLFIYVKDFAFDLAPQGCLVATCTHNRCAFSLPCPVYSCPPFRRHCDKVLRCTHVLLRTSLSTHTYTHSLSLSHIVIGHINPSSQQLRESLSTLNFLSFTRTIKTRPQVNMFSALPAASNAAVGRSRKALGGRGVSGGRRERARGGATAESLAV